jgi:hypothetical protein
MCTECKFCIHSTKTCEVKQLVDETIFIEKGIKNIRNFFLGFEKKVRSDKNLKNDSEVLIEMDYFKKQYALVYADYDALKNPVIEELIEVERKLFELHSSIKKSKSFIFYHIFKSRLYIQSITQE